MWWVDHYHEVNFNLWHYWKMVHGGGPCISRKNKEIDSPMRCGYMEAVFRMQCFGRMVIAKQKRDDLYWKNLSRNAKEVRRVLAQAQLEKIEADAKASILEAQEKRQDNKLSDACQFTQRVWRSKKTYERFFFSLFFFFREHHAGGEGAREGRAVTSERLCGDDTANATHPDPHRDPTHVDTAICHLPCHLPSVISLEV